MALTWFRHTKECEVLVRVVLARSRASGLWGGRQKRSSGSRAHEDEGDDGRADEAEDAEEVVQCHPGRGGLGVAG